MTFTAMQFDRHMFNGASVSFAQADSFCAQTASMHSANSIVMLLGAIIMASIIICTLTVSVIVRLVSVSLLVLASLILVSYLCLPAARRKA